MSNTPNEVRELNKLCRSIYRKNGLFYGDDVQEEKELQKRFKEAVRLSETAIDKIIKNLNNAKSVQLCFLMDATGSMKNHIQEVKNCITKIVDILQDKLQTAIPMQNFAVAFVGYRDIGDAIRFEILDFVTDIEQFRTFCNKIVAGGGGDAPEDVFGGLNKVNQLNWDSKYGTHVLFHMGDAPCHGRDYHNFKDDYPDGDPDKNDINDIFGKFIEKSIQYYFGRITPHTDTMLKKFNECYKEEILTFEVKDAVKVCECVAKSVELSISKSVKESVIDLNPKNKKRKIEIDTKIPNWEELEVKECALLCYELPPNMDHIMQMKPLNRKAHPGFKMKVAPKPFAYGSERLAYYGLDVRFGTSVEIVLKEMLYEDMREPINYETPAQIQTIAAFLAHKFNEAANESKKIVVLEPRVIHITETGKLMAVEKKFENASFVRFQNNAGYTIDKQKAEEEKISEYFDLVMAFSHWTHQITHQELMVVDIQGTVDQETRDFLITDPAIHCRNPTLYRPLNLGEKGFALFYEYHECNDICQRLRLRNPKHAPPSWLSLTTSPSADPLDKGPVWLKQGGFSTIS